MSNMQCASASPLKLACKRLQLNEHLLILACAQCLGPQRCAEMAAYGWHQIEHFATHGHSRSRCAHMLRQVPPAGCSGADARHYRPPSKYCPYGIYIQPSDGCSEPIPMTSPYLSYRATTPSYRMRPSRPKDLDCWTGCWTLYTEITG